jgi:uncharacterized protein YndB with AHSA1/START domain
MTRKEKSIITVSAVIKAQVDKVWTLWTDPMHIIHWNNASDDWHTTRAENDLRAGGKFMSRMEARDGSIGFDFTGKYTYTDQYKIIEYLIDDGRKVRIDFISHGKTTEVTETFEAEQTNSIEMQRAGWQSIMNNFKKYTESYGKYEVMHFEITINTNAEKVFNIMLDEEKYKEWTYEFNPSSHFKGSWEKGSKMLFIGTSSDGNTGGMISKIKENIPGRFISIEHLGEIKNGKEVNSGPEVDEWSGALENYTLKDVDGATLLEIDIDSIQKFKSYFAETWPKALKRLKLICEK